MSMLGTTYRRGLLPRANMPWVPTLARCRRSSATPAWPAALLCLLLTSLPGRLAAQDANATEPAELRSYVTWRSIGLEWDLRGDANHNARCRVQYRRQGDSAWQPALDLLRIDVLGRYGDVVADRHYNMLAGSILFLDPGTTYEVQLELTDPEGGATHRTLTIATRPQPQFPTGGRTWHVAPGANEGDGSSARPFGTLRAAQAAARPGDVVLLHAGHYGTVTLDKSGRPGTYLTYVAAGDGEAVFERLDVAASHLWLEGLVLRRGASSSGLKANGPTRDVIVRRLRCEGYHYAITLNRQAEDWQITDNTIIGDKTDLDSPDVQSNISGEGIELNHSSGHEVAYNRIERVADGISYPHRNCDIFGNDLRDLTDDGIEPDYGYANIRIWGNRIHRARYHGISFQPQFCGPWYIVRNEIASRGSVLKPNVADRFVLVSNTLLVERGQAQRNADLMLKALSRNNLWIVVPPPDAKGGEGPIWHAQSAGRGERYSMDYQAVADWRTDVDYDGFDWGRARWPMAWEVPLGQRRTFADLASFAAAVGIERHGLRVRKEELFEISDILAYLREPYSPRRLTLRAGAAAIDAGQPLPNLCATYHGQAPDLGAYEFGAPPPHYGPRPRDAQVSKP